MTITQKTTITIEFLAKLLEQFKSKPNISAILTAFLDQAQDLENASFEVLEETVLATAAGVQLDGIGTIVDEERQGRNDADYRIGLQARILLNISSGATEELIAIVDALTGGSAVIEVEEVSEYPAGFIITVQTPISNGVTVGAFVLLAKPAGVAAHFIYFAAPLGTEFRFDTAGQGLDEGLLGDAVAG